MESPSLTKPDSWLRDSESTARAWLRVDAPTAARFEPHNGGRNGQQRADRDLRGGVSRWRRGISLRRALVLLRRYLLLAAAVALLAAIAIGLAGGDRRTWWLLAPLALALVGVGFAMRRRVTIEQTARMFDDDLALRNRVETALELSARNGASSANGNGAGDRASAELGAGDRASAELGAGDRASAELAARVTGEATAAVSKSFGTVRLRMFGAPLEWLALAALALAVALLLALAPGGTAASTTHAGSAGRLGHGSGSGTTRHGRHASHGAPRALPPPASATLPLMLARQRHGGEPVNPYVPQLTAQQLRQEYLNSLRNQGTRDFLHVVHSSATSPNGVAGQPGLAGRPGKSTPSEQISSQLSSAGGLGAPTKVPSGDNTPGGAVNPRSPSTGSHAGLSKTPGRGGITGSQHGAGGHAGLGGNQAGSAPGGSALGPGLAPDLPHGSVGLPLQAGYAPSTSKHGHSGEGTSQTPNGGGSGGHTAQSNSTAGGGSGFVVIPPSSDATSSGDQTQRDNYFGVANQLQLKSW